MPTHTNTHIHASITFGFARVCVFALSLPLCVCVFVCLASLFYGLRFGPSHLCLFSYFCGLPLFAYISTTFVVSPVSVCALDTCQNMTSLPATAPNSPAGHNQLPPHALLESTSHSVRPNAQQILAGRNLCIFPFEAVRLSRQVLPTNTNCCGNHMRIVV